MLLLLLVAKPHHFLHSFVSFHTIDAGVEVLHLVIHHRRTILEVVLVVLYSFNFALVVLVNAFLFGNFFIVLKLPFLVFALPEKLTDGFFLLFSLVDDSLFPTIFFLELLTDRYKMGVFVSQLGFLLVSFDLVSVQPLLIILLRHVCLNLLMFLALYILMLLSKLVLYLDVVLVRLSFHLPAIGFDLAFHGNLLVELRSI